MPTSAGSEVDRFLIIGNYGLVHVAEINGNTAPDAVCPGPGCVTSALDGESTMAAIACTLGERLHGKRDIFRMERAKDAGSGQFSTIGPPFVPRGIGSILGVDNLAGIGIVQLGTLDQMSAETSRTGVLVGEHRKGDRRHTQGPTLVTEAAAPAQEAEARPARPSCMIKEEYNIMQRNLTRGIEIQPQECHCAGRR